MSRLRPICQVCGSFLSIVTWTCVRGAHCRPPKADPVEPEDGTTGRQPEPREAQISNREGGEMMELKEALEALKPFAKTAAVLGDTKDSAIWAGQKPAPPLTFGDFRRAAKAYEALSRLSLEEGGEKASQSCPSAHVADATATEAQHSAGAERAARIASLASIARYWADAPELCDINPSPGMEHTVADLRFCLEGCADLLSEIFKSGNYQ